MADSPQHHRYVITLDGSEVGHLSYRRAGEGRLALLHAEVDPGVGGRGLGSRLVAFALQDARRRQVSVLPHCPFVRSYIEGHGEYLDLVDEADRARFGL